jgi:enterochelin esterase-like enzyme
VRVFVPDPHPKHARGALDAARRPALILFDGQNVFEDEGSYAGGWRAHEAAARVSRTIPLAPMVVGVEHGGAARIAELSPFAPGGGPGGAAELVAHLASTLVPALRRTFGVTLAPESTVIGGSSMGGLAALYAHLRHPEVFGGALAMSPSLWAGGGELLSWAAGRGRPPGSRIYLDAGAREAGGRMLEAARRFASTLTGAGWNADTLLFRPDPRGGHNEAAWRRRLPAAMRFVFRERRGVAPRGAGQ